MILFSLVPTAIATVVATMVAKSPRAASYRYTPHNSKVKISDFHTK